MGWTDEPQTYRDINDYIILTDGQTGRTVISDKDSDKVWQRQITSVEINTDSR